MFSSVMLALHVCILGQAPLLNFMGPKVFDRRVAVNYYLLLVGTPLDSALGWVLEYGYR